MSTIVPYLLRSRCTQKMTNTHSDIQKLPKGFQSGKNKDPFLKECHSQVLQQSLKDLDRAYTNFFEKRANFPKYRKKFRHDSIRFPQGVELDEVKQKIRLPKIGWVGYRKSQDIIGTIKNVTIIRRGDKWDVCIQTEYEDNPPAPTPSEIGIDMGVKYFATLSDGKVFEPLSPFKREREKLAILQKELARQKKGSRNSRKTKRKIARLHRHIADSRRDFLHKTSTRIAQNHSTVYVEDLKVSNMSASAAGTIENPGKKVKQKSGLNRSILDQGWYAFSRMLSYKLERKGGKLIKVDPRNTSRTCPQCGLVSAENRKTQASFACVACGYRANADLVGAINVLRAGRARSTFTLRCTNRVCDNTCSPRLTLSLRNNGKSYFTDTWAQFIPLHGVLFQ